MTAVGIDFGNMNAVLSAARGRGIETLLNEFSSRLNPGLVYLENTRIIGESAKPQSITRFANTAASFKRLIGCKYDDPHAQIELKRAHFRHHKMEDGSIGITMTYQGEDQVFTPEQVTAMFFTKLKDIVENDLKKPLTTLVLSAPMWYTDRQRQALRYACEFAGINVARVYNDTTAAALAYGIYKADLPEADVRKVVFVDFGHSSLQVSVVGLSKGKMKVLGSACDPYLGGRDFDEIVVAHFAKLFEEKTKINLFENPRGLLRLAAECEKLKKLMSANTQRVPMNIECLFGDHDFRGGMARPEFEEMCAELFERVEKTLRKALRIVGPEEIYAVEIFGGSSRVPKFKQLIQEVFQKEANTTLNADESVAKGCTWQAAFHSPTHRPREFASIDTIYHAIDLLWSGKDEEGKPTESRKTVFDVGNAMPSTKVLTFYRSEPFELTAVYTKKENNVCHQDIIRKFTINNVKPAEGGGDSLIKVKLRVNADGVFDVCEAHSIVETMVPEEPQEKMEVDKKEGDKPAEGENKEEAEPAEPAEPKMVKKINKTSLAVSSGILFTEDQIAEYSQKEADMAQHDRNEKSRLNSKNAVEELSYDLRDKLEDNYKPYVLQEQVDEIFVKLDDMVDWLYGDGEDCEKKLYDEKLDELKSISEPIALRYREGESRPRAEAELRAAIAIARNAVRLYSEGNEKYAHLEQAEMQKVGDAIEAKEQWLNEKMAEQKAAPLHEVPVVQTASIEDQMRKLQTTINPILNKPKPAPKVATPPPQPKAEEPKAEATTETPTTETPAEEPKTEGMDVDVD